MRPGIWLFWGVVVALLFNAVMQWRTHRRERHIDRVVQDIHAVLVVWAETWPDAEIRARLLKAIRR